MLMFTVALTQMIENAAIAIILAPVAYQIARRPRGSKAVHDRLGYLYFNVVLHARCP
jgi:di/tricarboxylate transporter